MKVKFAHRTITTKVVIWVANKPQRPCNSPGCPNLTIESYCDDHRAKKELYRGSASSRGYNYRWQQYSKRFLKRPENVLCRLQLEGCTTLAKCVDHIDPPDGPGDPRFWDKRNHQAACIRCNSVKGRQKIEGKNDPFKIISSWE